MQRHWVLLLSVVCFVVGMWTSVWMQRRVVPATTGVVSSPSYVVASSTPALANGSSRGTQGVLGDLYRRWKPSVVNISTRKTVRGGPRLLLDRATGLPRIDVPEESRESLGSGLLLTGEGNVLTNYHVIAGADEIAVQLADGRQLPARVVGGDGEFDLAVVRIEGASGLPPAILGDSDKVQVGDEVFAIGNPLGLGHSLTTGIISYRGRALGDEDDHSEYLQTDTAINPGNSGGPLFNMAGEVIGINTLIGKNSEGIGFSIPINVARAVVPILERQGRFPRGYLGVVFGHTLPQGVSKGVLISQVKEETPAARAGLQGGDVIVRLGQVEVSDAWSASRALRLLPGGASVEIALLRAGKSITATVVLGNREELSQRPMASHEVGIVLEAAPAALLSPYRLERGVVVREVRAGTRGARVFQPGDILLAVNGSPVLEPGAAVQALDRAGPHRVTFLRGGAHWDLYV